jgi:chromosome segregation ATPase
MGLDYGYTCPDINQSIDGLKSDIIAILRDMASEICPLLSSETLTTISKEHMPYIYDIIEGCVEDVRRTNSDLRSSAEKQIDKLEDEVEYLKNEIKGLEDKVADLEDSVDDLEEEINNLKK